jgi:hypothetical protein
MGKTDDCPIIIGTTDGAEQTITDGGGSMAKGTIDGEEPTARGKTD